jgi:hypothetical protein
LPLVQRDSLLSCLVILFCQKFLRFALSRTSQTRQHYERAQRITRYSRRCR